MVKPVSTKNAKITEVPVIPTMREAEARESFEPGRAEVAVSQNTTALHPG